MGRLLTLHGPGDAEDLIGEPRRRHWRPDDAGTAPNPLAVMSERVVITALRDVRRALLFLALAVAAVGLVAAALSVRPP